ncbi:MAG: carbohydrate-binding domain-containing protein [Clostridia bacterium]|nr:carbohydrate-binding domain-containing protein [Clostridia bacterium]
MKKMSLKKIVCFSLSLILIIITFCSCSLSGSKTESTAAADAGQTDEAVVNLLNQAEASAAKDGATSITLSGSTAQVSGSGAKAEDGIVTINQAGTYVLSGTMTDGRVIVDAQGQEVVLILSDVSISCSYSSPLYIYKSSKTTVYLEQGSQNVLTDGSTYNFNDSYSSQTDEEPNACLFSKSDLVIAGEGSLTVNAGFNNGITSKDTLQIENASLTVNAKANGIGGKDYLTLKNASLTVTSGADGIRSTNDTDPTLGYVIIAGSALKLNAGEDGIQAQTTLTVSDSQLDITTSAASAQTESSKGIKAEGDIKLEGGTFTVNSTDDAIHSNSNVTVYSGSYTLNTDDDALHADYQVTVNGGTIDITAHEGIEATLVTINGGEITINASDDGINAAQQTDSVTPTVETNDGTLTIIMGQGDTDAIDSNGNITVNGGTVNITGQSAFDYDGQGTLNGGTVTVNGEKVSQLTNQFAGGMMGGPGGQGGFGARPGGFPGNGQ